MTDTPVPGDSPLMPRSPLTPAQPPRWRQRAASFWLGLLFRLADTAPGLIRALRPPAVRLAYAFSPAIRRNTAANARCIFGPAVSRRRRRKFALSVTGCFYDVVADIGRSARAQRADLIARIESVQGLDQYLAVRAGGRGAVILTAHMGSFEVGLAALSQYEPNIHVVFQRDPFDDFERLRATLRRRLNVSEATVDEGWPMWVRLRDALQRNEVVTIQGDRVMPGQKGTCVPLLGGHILLPPGPMKLAAAAGAPIIPIFSLRTGRDKLRICIEPPIHLGPGPDAIAAAMNQWAHTLATYITRHPEQWLMLDNAFRPPPTPDSAS